MASLTKAPSHVAHIGYNGFNMSNLLKFSSTTGELLPVYYDILQPGDKVNINTVLKTRTMELESAAMCSLKEHLEWFFVPLNQIYSIAGDWFNGIQDLKSSLFEPNSLRPVLPSFSPSEFTQLLETLRSKEDSYFPFSSYYSEYEQGRTPLKGTSFRLLELLGVPLSQCLPATETSTVSFSMSYVPLFVCAYQKIWSDFYRLSDREVNNPKVYNMDNWYESDYSHTQTDLFTLRYRPWRKDFFTNLLTSPLFGAHSENAFTREVASANPQLNLAQSVQQWLTSVNFNTFAKGAWTNSTVIQPNPNGQLSQVPNLSLPSSISPDGLTASEPNRSTLQFGNLQQALSPTSIRTSFAVQKLLEITRRAGKHYDKQTLAHFGVDVPEGIAGEVTYIGGSVSRINIGDVIATAGTESDPLGKIAGKGYGADASKGMKFSAPCHGILMCIYSCEPEADYQANMYDKLNTLLNLSDWPRPEFDNLGMQPLFGYQVKLTNSAVQNTQVCGWQYRWTEFKQKYNRVCGSLARSLHYWTPQRNAINVNSNDSDYPTQLRYYYITPSYLDDIMLVPYQFDLSFFADETHQAEGTSGILEAFNNDPLFHELYFDVKKASKMSVYGLENL